MSTGEEYTTSTVPFTSIEGHELLVDILLPTGLADGKHPIIVNWHGGALVTGSRYFKELFPAWLPPWAGKNNAIVLSPDYRKLPEARGADIIEDVEAFWTWLQTHFPQTLDEITSGKHQADLGHVLLGGGSAGGWTALHQALSHPDQVRAVMVRFPMLDINHVPLPPYAGPNPPYLGVPLLSREKLDMETAKLKRPSFFTAGGMERAQLAFSAMNLGVIGEWIGTDENLDVFKRINAGGHLPKRLWVTHGRGDSVVPLKGTEKLVATVEENCPQTEVRVKYFDGDHAWDLTQPELAKEVEGGLEWIKAAWLND